MSLKVELGLFAGLFSERVPFSPTRASGSTAVDLVTSKISSRSTSELEIGCDNPVGPSAGSGLFCGDRESGMGNVVSI
jgi:hypothetical protein